MGDPGHTRIEVSENDEKDQFEVRITEERKPTRRGREGKKKKKKVVANQPLKIVERKLSFLRARKKRNAASRFEKREKLAAVKFDAKKDAESSLRKLAKMTSKFMPSQMMMYRNDSFMQNQRKE